MMKYLFMLLSILPLEGLGQDIEVQALFAGAAVLVIDGQAGRGKVWFHASLCRHGKGGH